MGVLDRKITVEINLDDGTIISPKNVTYYTTDKNIANIYIKLKRTENGITKYISKDDVNNYTVKLNIVLPKTLNLSTLVGTFEGDTDDLGAALYRFELEDKYMKQSGKVICEPIIVSNEEEMTIDYFAYDTKLPKTSEYNMALIIDPDMPILKSLIQEVKETVQAVNNIDNNNVSDTKTYSNKKIEEKFTDVDSQIKDIENKTNNTYNDLYYKGIKSCVFTPNQDFNSRYFRIPFMTTTKRGTIVAGSDVRYNSADDQSFIDIGIARSIDGGLTWTDKKIVMRNSRQDSTYSRCMDGTILYDKDVDRIWLLGNLWHTGFSNWTSSNTQSDPNWDIQICYSDDDGITWSTPTSLRSLCPTGYSQFIGGVGNGIKTSNGTLIFPIQVSPIGQRPSLYTESGFIYSHNNGLTWNTCNNFVPGFASECNIVEYDGKLIINCRQERSDKRKIYYTTDMGNTWLIHKLSKTTLQNSVCQGSMIKIPYDEESILFSSNDGEGRTALNLKVMNNSQDEFNGVTTIVSGATNGYSCLSYCELNKKLYVVHEDWGRINFIELTYALKDLKKCKSITNVKVKETSFTEFVDIYILNNGNDNNDGLSQHSAIRTFARLKEIMSSKAYTKVTIHIDSNYNDPFRLASIQGDVRIQAHPRGLMNLKKVYIRNIPYCTFEDDINIVESFNDSYCITVEGSNVEFKSVTCNIQTDMSIYYNINSTISNNGNLITNKTYNALITAKNNTSTQLYVNLTNNNHMPFIMGDLTNHTVNIQEGEVKVLATGLSPVFKKYGDLKGGFGINIGFNKAVKPVFDGVKTEDRNNETTCYISNSLVNYIISLNAGSGETLYSNDKLFTIPPIFRPIIEKRIPITLYGNSGSLLGTILCKVKTSGEVTLLGNPPTGVKEIYGGGSYSIV